MAPAVAIGPDEPRGSGRPDDLEQLHPRSVLGLRGIGFGAGGVQLLGDWRGRLGAVRFGHGWFLRC